MTEFEIEAVSTLTPWLAHSMIALIHQLSSSASGPRNEDLESIIKSPATTLLIARTDQTLQGMLTLAIFRVPTGVRSIIEDVIVDERHRGLGIASALVREALAQAKTAGARTVDLTSRPSREAANRLYLKLGFEKRQTNVYRFAFEAT
ncbi:MULTISPECIES: GNAT family N-acetyltransferase [unclassified Mesorhizobium]|uniref:GNAT family N-acetyltransferase n=1 Tax=unclassified Mesorhizobium TaxID=325217 RepID=UPI000FD9A5D3|nr:MULTISPECIES: GNAT family N-acetyltransferase [unclassified Mesorhizobium]TGQ44007.1 GNAT family N-acetyltransferase [Mesorhizobium sp. M00.F.Ca.ET.216.01.1.1]TIS59151.1 MAG: GNAT family N-acetyltransferase [Mesorhizobium sp.]TIS90840.1 MAG: GNAT family N-acetyltransferase [Mesorhizobium sp.]TJW16036.1 MAG: GNAT family N-acetyltransferase [Mesorhizobium sp.]TJW48546.1 MAG: GNAT family N-acetyltransferase [Mesorhizobium sp.]